MTLAAFLVVALLSMMASGFFCGSEIGLYRLNRVRLRVRADRGEPRALSLMRLMENEQEALTTTLIGNAVTSFLLTATVAHMLNGPLGFSDNEAEGYTTLILTPAVFVFCEVLPKTWFQREADRLMYAAAVPLRLAHRVFHVTGLVWLLGRISRWLTQAITGASAETVESVSNPRRRIIALLREGMATESAHPEQSDMIERVLKLSAIPVHTAMVPKSRMVGISASTGRAALIGIARKAPHSRLPVYEGDSARIVGILSVHEALADPGWKVVREKTTPPIYFDPNQTVASALLALQRAGQPMAIVVDRLGRALGVVTLKDLLEEIVGDLEAW